MSKGNTQARAFQQGDFDAVAFKGMRHRLLTVLQVVGLLPAETPAAFERRFLPTECDFAFASVVRCSLTGVNRKKGFHTAESPYVLPAFQLGSEGKGFIEACVDQHLVGLPTRTNLVLLLGNTGNYMKSFREMIARRRGQISQINTVSFRSHGVRFVHLAHPSKGNGHFNAYIQGEGTPGEKRQLAMQAIAGQ